MSVSSSDSHVWLQNYARLCEDAFFRLLSPSHQFEQLRQSLIPEHPAVAATIAGWAPVAQEALLNWLADELAAMRASARKKEIWRVRKADRELSCIAVDWPTGFDLRLMEGTEFLRTALVPDASTVAIRAMEWLSALIDKGWQQAAP